VEASINPPRVNTVMAKTSREVGGMILRESPSSDLRFLMIFIV
tara:strand:- start:255 stop:383 length:129 start_codon:yes stop_codon:yes gene_type:complete